MNPTLSNTIFHQHYPVDSSTFHTLVFNHVKLALDEDVGTGDLTAQLIPATQIVSATIITRDHATVCGIPWANQAFSQIDKNIHITWHVTEGDVVTPNQLLCNIKGSARAVLTAERCALNFLQTLSAVATETQRYVEITKHTKAKILDTRKTLPGLRLAQKYAVTIGGGYNQRLALYDGILIKENHIAAAGGIAAVLQQTFALNISSNVNVQIEVENLAQLSEALTAGASNILLDNFNLAMMKQAVIINAGRALLEASGGVNLSTVKAIAETGIDRISIGGLTKNIQAIDLSLRIQSTT